MRIFFEKYVGIKIEEHKILVLASTLSQILDEIKVIPVNI